MKFLWFEEDFNFASFVEKLTWETHILEAGLVNLESQVCFAATHWPFRPCVKYLSRATQVCLRFLWSGKSRKAYSKTYITIFVWYLLYNTL